MKKYLINSKWKRSKQNKKYIKKYRLYPAFLYSYLDKWLKSMSSKGWHIVHCTMFSFTFEKGKPKQKEYFTYGLGTQEGKYNLSLLHPFLEEKYGYKKSKINSNNKKSYQIVEIDLKRHNIETDVGYKELISDRNNLYLRFFIRNTVIFLAIALLLLVICMIF